MLSYNKEERMESTIKELFLEEINETTVCVDIETILNSAYAQVEKDKEQKESSRSTQQKRKAGQSKNYSKKCDCNVTIHI